MITNCPSWMDSIKLSWGTSTLRLFIIVLLSVSVLPVSARMYQWDNPDTGRTHLSGTPPAWYRTGNDGPRVFVFEGGQLVDDTGVAVSEEKRRTLRQQALIEAADNKKQARQRAEQAVNPSQSLSGEEASAGQPPPLAVPESTTESLPVPPPSQEDNDTEQLSPEEVAAMRALIEEWESRSKAANQRRVETLGDAARNTDRPSTSESSKPDLTREQVRQYLESRSQGGDAQED